MNWDTSGAPHREVVNWLQSEPVLDYFDGGDDLVLADDFSCAWPQLMAIRSSLADAQT